jgi:hypothetical protein
MCLASSHKVEFVCAVGDLKPGQRYRDPDGNEFLITDGLPAFDSFATVVNVATGEMKQVRTHIRLGYDRLGRLYAARRLNPPTKVTTPTTVLNTDPSGILPDAPIGTLTPCPYCQTPCHVVDTKGRHVNGIEPTAGNGCEFCNPPAHPDAASDT